MRYDVMIIGGGPGGYTAANKAAGSGLNTILFEKDQIGGTCLNRGCIPMKSLIQSAHVYRDARDGELFGVCAENVSLDYDKVKERRGAVVSQLRTESLFTPATFILLRNAETIKLKDDIELLGSWISNPSWTVV